MKTKLFVIFLLIVVIVSNTSAQKKNEIKTKENKMQETSIFKIDNDKKEIISPASTVKDYLKLNFISVTTDQPIYWPNEDIYLKVAFPLFPNAEVKITLQKKDATPKVLGIYKLNESGLLINKILSGKEKRIEEGEYKAEVSINNKNIQTNATFSVVEGTLGAVSFAHEFEQITDSKDLEKKKGAWFLGNAAGIGMRWGNGLNVKNELRVFNQPYNGHVTIKSRCFLPGCNGVEAGKSIESEVKNGLVEAVVEIGGHSGPFEIEIITPKGSVRNLFAKSGHVERQSIPLTKNLSNIFNATLAPYEGTKPIYGRQIFIEKSNVKNDDAIEIIYPVANNSNEIEAVINKDIKNAKLFVYYPDKENNMECKEIKIGKNLSKGEHFKISCSSPYTFFTIGGFINNSKDFYEGWAIAFTESPLEINITSPKTSNPMKSVQVTVKVSNRTSNKGVETYGILEVFDNRVPSKSALDPLISSIGDSFRGLSNYLSTWRDWTGISIDEEAADNVSSPSKSRNELKKSGAARSMNKLSAAPSVALQGIISNTEESAEEITETIREGEQKVVFCQLLKTDANGEATTEVTLPPQIGRCKIRFVAIDKYEYLEKIEEIDVQKNNYAEINIQPLLLPDSRVIAYGTVFNKEKENLRLLISGAGIVNEITKEIKPGSNEIAFEMYGKNYGKLNVQLMSQDGKIKDHRQIEIRDVSNLPTTFSEIQISDGNEIKIEKGKKVAIYQNPAKLLKGILMDVITTMHSWFGHSEALSASCAIRAMILRAIEDKVLDDEGLRETLKADLVKTVKDLNEVFYNSKTGLVAPYPNVSEKPIWSIWFIKNLRIAVNALEENDKLKEEFSTTISTAKEMISNVEKELKKREISFDEQSFSDAEGIDMIPIVIDGKVIYKAITDDAVIKWYVKKVAPIIDLPDVKSIEEINQKFIKNYDTFRFLKAFERTGNIYYLLLNAKALLIKNDKEFIPLFNKIAKGMIATNEPGMIKGPALLGGVYSSPNTLVKFLEIMIELSKKKMITDNPEVKILTNNSEKTIIIKNDFLEYETKESDARIKSPQFVTLRIDKKYEINIYEYLSRKPFFAVSSEKNELKVGEENEIIVTLDKDKDPSEYYAIIAVPSNLSIRQTDDLLSDYKGQLLYGQRVGGGLRIQMLTTPFRGSYKLSIHTEATLKGSSEGYVLVRHINNPEIISTIKISMVNVK